jgi:hypothetical protein
VSTVVAMLRLSDLRSDQFAFARRAEGDRIELDRTERGSLQADRIAEGRLLRLSIEVIHQSIIQTS